jgi:hypothetical protein
MAGMPYLLLGSLGFMMFRASRKGSPPSQLPPV